MNLRLSLFCLQGSEGDIREGSIKHGVPETYRVPDRLQGRALRRRNTQYHQEQ